jgi:anti-sigma regulatory factor (Ser/Thr protein kinase)
VILTEPRDQYAQMTRTIPASLWALEEFCCDFRSICGPFASSSNRFAAELLLRETLTNAVVHGCHSDASRRVRCMARVRANRVTIAVEDDGDGFDWQAALRRRVGANCCSGRGFEILAHFATRFHFNRSGNRITVVRIFCEIGVNS